ncbi:MAG: hypothetical protein ACTHL0_04980 [Trinickia sp.]
MAMIERRSRVGHSPHSKRLSVGAPLATRGYRVLAAVAVAMACALATGCDGAHDAHDDLDTHAQADATSMLPGTRDAAAPAASARAQRFDTSDGTPTHAASDALLPPVMHTAD